MRINSVQNNGVKFKSLHINNVETFFYKDVDIKRCANRLANTKIMDVVIDKHGLSIKEKKADILHRIQSFSLFPKENSVGINMVGEKEAIYKIKYNSLEKAKNVWEKLVKISRTHNALDEYTIIALWLEKYFAKNNNPVYKN